METSYYFHKNRSNCAGSKLDFLIGEEAADLTESQDIYTFQVNPW